MRVYFFPRTNLKEVVSRQQLYKPGMSHSEEIKRRLIRNSIKDRGKFTRSNKANGNIRQISKEQTVCRYYSSLKHVGNISLMLTYR